MSRNGINSQRAISLLFTLKGVNTQRYFCLCTLVCKPLTVDYTFFLIWQPCQLSSAYIRWLWLYLTHPNDNSSLRVLRPPSVRAVKHMTFVNKENHQIIFMNSLLSDDATYEIRRGLWSKLPIKTRTLAYVIEVNWYTYLTIHNNNGKMSINRVNKATFVHVDWEWWLFQFMRGLLFTTVYLCHSHKIVQNLYCPGNIDIVMCSKIQNYIYLLNILMHFWYYDFQYIFFL